MAQPARFVAWMVLGLGLGTAAEAQGLRVSLPLPRPPGFAAQDTFAFRASSDGAWVVYLADEGSDDLFELYGVPSDGSAPARKLSGPLVAGGHLVEVAEQGLPPVRTYEPPHVRTSHARVAYRADQEVDEVHELFAAPLDGSTPAVKVSGTLVAGGDVGTELEFALGGARLVYVADALVDERPEVFSAPSDGSLSPVSLSGPLQQFGTTSANASSLRVTPDGGTVVYCGVAPFATANRIFAVPADGSAPPRPVSTRRVETFALTPDGARVVYGAWDSGSYLFVELWTAPLDGGEAPRRLDARTTTGSVASYAVSPDATRAVYLADHELHLVPELWSVPLDGSGLPLRLHPPLAAGQGVRAFAIGPDGARVVYAADADVPGTLELYSVPADGSAAPVKLSPAPVPGGGVAGGGREHLLELGLERAVWVADARADEVFELFSAPLDGSAPAVRLSGPLPPAGDVEAGPDGAWAFRIAPDGRQVVYRADARLDAQHELWLVPADGSAAPVRLSGAMTTFGGVPPEDPRGIEQSFAFTPDGTRVLYRADQEIDERFDLWSARLDRPGRARRLDPPLDPGPAGAVGGFVFGAAGRLVYGDGRVFSLDLGRYPREGAIPFARLGTGRSLAPSPEGMRVAFESSACDPYWDGCESSAHLWCAAVDGSAPAALLNGELGGRPVSLRYTPDGTRLVVHERATSDPRSSGGLFSMPSDGSASPTSLTEPPGMVWDQTILDFRISPDGQGVVYTKTPGNALVHVPLDRSREPSTLLAGLDPASAFEITLDSTRAVLRSDLATPGTSELWSVALDASTPPVRLHAPLPAGGTLASFRLSPDGERVVAAADLEESGVLELWSLPLDPARGLPILRLSAKGVPGGDVGAFELAPDGTRAVFLADLAVDEQRELWSAPLDAATPSVRLNGVLAPDEDVASAFRLGADSRRVVFVVASEPGAARLFSAPLDGSLPAVALSAPFVPGGSLWQPGPGDFSQAFALGPDGRHVAYLADALADEVFELFLVPIDGRWPARRVNPPLVPGGDVRPAPALDPLQPFAFSRDGRFLAYLADQLVDGEHELFLSWVDPPHVRAAPPPPGGGP